MKKNGSNNRQQRCHRPQNMNESENYFLSAELIQDINHEIININSDKSILEMIKSGVSFI